MADAPEAIEVRPPTPADLPALGDLYRAVKGRPRPEAVTRHRFFDTPWGDSTSLVGFDGDRCVCAVVFWPVAMRVGDEIVPGAQGMDAVTHPAYRNRPRLFPTMARAGCDLTREHGIELLYTFPNARSIKATKFVGATYLGEIASWGVALESRRLRLPQRGRQPGLEVGGLAPDELDALIAVAHAGRDVVRIDKSRTWLSWRYSELSCECYEWLSVRDGAGGLAGAALLGERDPERWGADFAGIVRIHEIFAASEGAALSLLDGAIEHVRRAGGRKLDILVKEPVIERALEQSGFRRETPHPMTTIRHGTTSLALDTHDFARWRVVSGDHDFF
jgi:hypothetical protein